MMRGANSTTDNDTALLCAVPALLVTTQSYEPSSSNDTLGMCRLFVVPMGIGTPLRRHWYTGSGYANTARSHSNCMRRTCEEAHTRSRLLTLKRECRRFIV